MAKRTVKKIKTQFRSGVVHIYASFNNTIITVTNEAGEVLSWASGGSCGFKGARKSTPFAAQMAAKQVAKNILEYGVKQIQVIIKGAGPGRENAIRTLQLSGLSITMIKDRTPIPHNGCRAPKKRRV